MLPNDSVQYLPGPVVHRRGSDVTEIANSEVNFEKVSKEKFVLKHEDQCKKLQN